MNIPHQQPDFLTLGIEKYMPLFFRCAADERGALGSVAKPSFCFLAKTFIISVYAVDGVQLKHAPGFFLVFENNKSTFEVSFADE